MQTNDCYELLREFASPVVAITSNWNGRANGMISDSVLRASISPRVPRLSVYIHKWHFSHDQIWNSGRFGLHLLHRDQLDLVHRLGFASGRDRNKLTDVPHRLGLGGVPLLQDCYAAFECQVINTMDTGYSTHYLADVVDFHPGHGKEILTPPWLRANLPAAWTEAFLENYRVAQEQIEQNTAIQDRRWTGPAPS